MTTMTRTTAFRRYEYQVTENAVVTSEFPLKGQKMPLEFRSLAVRVYSDRFITTTKEGNFTSISGGYIKDGVFYWGNSSVLRLEACQEYGIHVLPQFDAGRQKAARVAEVEREFNASLRSIESARFRRSAG